LITNAADEVMLVKPTYRDAWELPGGLAEVGESPRAATRRELLEELGLVVEIGRLLVIDWSAPSFRPDDGLMLVYAAGPVDPASIRLASDELVAWRWCDRRAVRERLLDFKARRVEAAMVAHASGAFLELEAGYLVPDNEATVEPA